MAHGLVRVQHGAELSETDQVLAGSGSPFAGLIVEVELGHQRPQTGPPGRRERWPSDVLAAVLGPHAGGEFLHQAGGKVHFLPLAVDLGPPGLQGVRDLIVLTEDAGALQNDRNCFGQLGDIGIG